MVNKNTIRIGSQILFFGFVILIFFLTIAHEFEIPFNIYSYGIYSIISLVILIGVIIVVVGLTQNN